MSMSGSYNRGTYNRRQVLEIMGHVTDFRKSVHVPDFYRKSVHVPDFGTCTFSDKKMSPAAKLRHYP